MKILIKPDLARYEARDHNSFSCPIATGINKRLGTGFRSIVTETHVRISSPLNGYLHTIETDSRLWDWIRKYDMSAIVPTDVTFEIEIPDEYVRAQ